ncbi:class I SAM-dependent methyltransferase [Candidatus Pacearchaeota archaeon]|nr:class I SAM-dependent methyltransferase [Candidatus Pacearchaeota archaeon]
MSLKSKEAQDFTKYYQQKKVTGTYDSQREKNIYRRKKRAKELRFFLEIIDKKPHEKVLELGCSSGFLTKHLGEVIAIDTSTDMLKIAHSKNNLAKCISGDMFNLNFGSDVFDKIVTMRVWNHLNEKDLRKALQESKRVLKQNGYLIFDAEEKNWKRKILAKIYQATTRITGFKIYQYSLQELKKILKEEGFKIEKGKFLYHRVGRQIILRTQKI